jgi:hypothetical protein
MVSRIHQDIPPRKISAYSTEPFSKYELMKILPIKMVISRAIGGILIKNKGLNIFQNGLQ